MDAGQKNVDYHGLPVIEEVLKPFVRLLKFVLKLV